MYLWTILKFNFTFVQFAIMSLISRKLENELFRETKYYPVITITGPRQSGKTTLCKSLFSDYGYFNLEDIVLLSHIKEDPKSFLNENRKGVIIDEVHHYPELFSFIQVIVDQHPQRKFILTGSSNFSLLQKITQSLAGRTALFTLLPLSLHELGDEIKKTTTDELILRGGYPGVWANHIPPDIFYRNYYSTYMERDIRQIANIKDLILFQKFIRLCAGRIGSECNHSHLANEVGISAPTIANWLSILSASYIAYLLPPYHENIHKRLIKTPKIYFYDVGLACYLLGIENEMHLKNHPLRGALFENMVVNEAMKNRFNQGKDPGLYFYKDKSQKEVDLIHVRANQLHAYEIKSSQTYNSDFYKGIHYIKNIFGERLVRSALIYDGDIEKNTEENGALNFRNFYL